MGRVNMRISQKFNLGKTQHELDFVDIDTNRDAPLFIDPYFLSTRNNPWSISASRTVQNFFDYLLALIQQRQNTTALGLFDHLHEPNETCLGLSRGAPSGRGVGSEESQKIFESISGSRAAQTGLLEHLEDCTIFIDGIGKDKLSDMTTNLIRGHLIEYTKTQCEIWKIPLEQSVASGAIWNRALRRWEETHTDMLVVDGRKILLVPKGIVSYSKAYIPYQFHQHYVLNFHQNEQLRLNGPLVQTKKRKDGSERKFVTKVDVKDRIAPFNKRIPNNLCGSQSDHIWRF